MALTTIDDRGLKTPIDLLDSEKIRFGTGDDLEIYHSGSHGFILNETGNLDLRSGEIGFYNYAGDEVLAKFTANGAVELYYDNSKKLETRSDGVGITGILNMSSHIYLGDNDYLYLGASNDIQLYHDTANSYFVNATGALRIYSGGAESIQCSSAGVTSLFHNGTEMCYTHANGFKLNDSKKLLIGTGNDLQIYHDGSHSWLTNSTGNFVIRNNAAAGDIHIQPEDAEEGIIVRDNGAVELYYDNAKKFETTSTGGQITGRLNIGTTTEGNESADELTVSNSGNTGITIRSTDSSNCSLFFSDATSGASEYAGYVQYMHSNDSLKFGTGTGERLIINTDGNIGFNRTNVDAGDSQTQNSTATPKRIVFNNDYSSGYTDASLKLYLFNDGTTRHGFTSGPAYDIQYHSSGSATGRHSFYVANTKTVDLDSDGLKFNGDTAEANALDDYEEGTFTLVLSDSSGNNETSGGTMNYTKIGRWVNCWGQCTFGNASSAIGSNHCAIKGWPFSTGSHNSNDIPVWVWNNGTDIYEDGYPSVSSDSNSTVWPLYLHKYNGAPNITGNDMGNNAKLSCAFSYEM